MQTRLTRQITAALDAMRQRFMPRAAAPRSMDGHEAQWRAQQFERAERERALFQLRALGWPSA